MNVDLISESISAIILCRSLARGDDTDGGSGLGPSASVEENENGAEGASASRLVE